ncbi:MAG: hypothetical protein MUO68_07305, partial [Desulfobacteraceae bacterium]|nr:hypothetical protein [Desulfobacteraceae bacterium]
MGSALDIRYLETFEKYSISFKLKAREDFDHRNILDISRIKIRTQRRDWADKRRLRKGVFCKGLILSTVRSKVLLF